MCVQMAIGVQQEAEHTARAEGRDPARWRLADGRDVVPALVPGHDQSVWTLTLLRDGRALDSDDL